MPKSEKSSPPTNILSNQVADVKTAVDRELAIFFDHKIAEAGRIDSHYRRLMQEIKKFNLRGGKRLRPFLVWLGWSLAGGTDEDAYLHLALAWEVYHLGALIHDDIMDRDHQRYGGPNIAGSYERNLRRHHSEEISAKHSLNAALMAGDALMLMAAEQISHTQVQPELRDRLLDHFYKVHFRLVGGQLSEDLTVLSANPSPATIRKIYLNKSGHYSMVAPLRSGAILAGANETILKILENFGLHAGVAFQISDDLLGMFGSTREIGKPNTSDLREGKNTLLMHYGFEFADDTQKVILNKYFGNPTVSAGDLKLVRKVLTDNGAKAKTMFVAEAEAEAAKKAIGRLALPGTLPQTFTEFTDYLIKRRS